MPVTLTSNALAVAGRLDSAIIALPLLIRQDVELGGRVIAQTVEDIVKPLTPVKTGALKRSTTDEVTVEATPVGEGVRIKILQPAEAPKSGYQYVHWVVTGLPPHGQYAGNPYPEKAMEEAAEPIQLVLRAIGHDLSRAIIAIVG